MRVGSWSTYFQVPFSHRCFGPVCIVFQPEHCLPGWKVRHSLLMLKLEFSHTHTQTDTLTHTHTSVQSSRFSLSWTLIHCLSKYSLTSLPSTRLQFILIGWLLLAGYRNLYLNLLATFAEEETVHVGVVSLAEEQSCGVRKLIGHAAETNNMLLLLHTHHIIAHFKVTIFLQYLELVHLPPMSWCKRLTQCIISL